MYFSNKKKLSEENLQTLSPIVHFTWSQNFCNPMTIMCKHWYVVTIVLSIHDIILGSAVSGNLESFLPGFFFTLQADQ